MFSANEHQKYFAFLRVLCTFALKATQHELHDSCKRVGILSVNRFEGYEPQTVLRPPPTSENLLLDPRKKTDL